MNPELYYAIDKEGISDDDPLRFINQAIAKGIQPLAKVWDTILKADSAVKTQNPDTTSAVLKVPSDVQLDLTELSDLIATTLMVLGNANVQTVQLRKDFMKPYLHYDYHELLQHSNQLTEFLFGQGQASHQETTWQEETNKKRYKMQEG